jgi:hypothetical protein
VILFLVQLLPQVKLLIEGADSQATSLARAIQRLGCEVRVPEADEGVGSFGSSGQVTLRCEGLNVPPQDPLREGATPLFFHDRVRVTLGSTEQIVWIYDGSVRVKLVLNDDTAVCTFGPDFQAGTEFVRTFVPVLLCMLLWLRGYYYVHGALAAMPGPGTLLLLGESGAGKSTTLLSLIKHGAQWFTDDMVFAGPADAAGSGLFGLPRDFHLTDETLQEFPQLLPYTLNEPRFREKASVRVSEMLPGWQREAPTPATILVLGERQERFEASALSQSEVFLALLRASAWGAVPGMPRTAEHQSALHGLACSTRGYSVCLRGNSIGDVQDLLDFLRRDSATGR